MEHSPNTILNLVHAYAENQEQNILDYTRGCLTPSLQVELQMPVPTSSTIHSEVAPKLKVRLEPIKGIFENFPTLKHTPKGSCQAGSPGPHTTHPTSTLPHITAETETVSTQVSTRSKTATATSSKYDNTICIITGHWLIQGFALEVTHNIPFLFINSAECGSLNF